MAHSPLPWRVSGEDPDTVVYSGTGECVTWIDAGPERINAEFIVRAVNSHAALLAALKQAEAYTSLNASLNIVTAPPRDMSLSVLRAIRNAIALAEATHG